MRKNIPYEPLDASEALKILYGKSVPDLTSQGYRKALNKLRQSDKALARRVERILAPILKKRVFPRRQREWYETSEGTRARLALLPENPHVHTDVCTIREVLHIPSGHIHTTEENPLWKELQGLVKPEGVRRVIEGNLASEWINVHRKVASHQTVMEEDREMLSTDMCESAVASAGVDLQASEVPEWLRYPLNEGSYKVLAAPLDWAAEKLIERHNLPQYALTPITLFVLTQDHSWIEGLNPLHIDISHNRDPSSDPEAFTIAMKGIDEFITKEDWDRVWTNYVKPRQKFLWERRGMNPQGRRTVDINRLKKALPLYQKMITESLEIKDMLYFPSDDLTIEDWDQETIRRVLSDLERVLTPKP